LSALTVMSRLSRPGALVMAVAIGALVLAGCSSSPPSEAAATGTSSGLSTAASADGSAGAPADQTAVSDGESATSGETAASTPAAATDTATDTDTAADTVTADAPVVISTPVPPPAGAGTGGEVAEVEMTTAAAVPLTETAQLGGVATAITNVSAVITTATGPGEIAGPAVAVQVQITNNSATPFNMDSVFVTLNDSGGTPGQPSTSDPASALTGELAPGAQAAGVYVFRVSTAGRNPITILVSNSDSAEVVSFVGDAA
jgi:hypothetical protein